MKNQGEQFPKQEKDMPKDQAKIDASRKLYEQLGEEEMMTLAGEINGLIDEKQRDKLTGLYNRGALFEKSRDHIGKAAEKGSDCAVIMLDYDDFKKINDIYGHAAGDKALKELAKIVKEIVPQPGFGARYGGEEFTVFLPNKDKEAAMEIAEKIRKAVEANPIIEEGHKIYNTISIGCASLSQAPSVVDGETMDRMLKLADKALYASKHTGKNRVTVYNERLED